MLGTVRFVLAALVVLNHLWLPTANKVGAHAVVAFYIVSGYLMTKVIQETYGPSLGGAFRFLANRWLRIFPIYWTCLFATLALLSAFGESFRPYSTINLPTAYDLFRNVTLYDLTPAQSILVPPAWSLTIEFLFYALMVALLARSRAVSTVWFVASLIFTAYLISTGANFGQRYYPATAASLFFSIGAMLHWYRLPTPDRRLLWPMLLTFCALPLISEMIGIDRTMTGYYAAALLFIPIFQIANTKPTALDKWLGDLAYPLFLSHFLCSGIVKLVLPQIPPLGLSFLVASFALSLGFSVLLVKLQAATIERMRATLRDRNMKRIDFLRIGSPNTGDVSK